MMHLNSIWIEGNLVSEPMKKGDDGADTLGSFRVASTRVFRGEREISVFDVEFSHPDLAKEAGVLEKGQGVRIIGRLHDSGDPGCSGVKIVAELVECRPRFNLCGRSLASLHNRPVRHLSARVE